MKKILWLLIFVLCYKPLYSQYQNEKEPHVILEAGVAPSWDLKSNYCALAPTIEIECSPAKNKLEIEVGVAPYYSSSGYSWQFEALFKKPYDISKRVEIMFGGGPQWSVSKQQNSFSVEAAADLMYWLYKRKVGLYTEPNYDYGLGKNHEQSFGFNAGIIIGLN